ncbi:hypothetical protein LEL_09991 [Akanthomyces lecanii RCEF 1005]|uniref:IDI-2 n=1 Tax=Akanthomyces lecanii RCEF 1005 TaxID=1081108 RepID=A0A168BIT6_CORDF|nr:hypothetical protein LEL_09991 [Akanthomyces lecanii RCEF 1005]
MKSVSILHLIVTAALLPANVLSQLSAEEICGDLGVLTITAEELSKVDDKGALRMCADHPLGRNRTLDVTGGASLAPWSEGESASDNNPLQSRACKREAPYGCADGYCWKACGDKRKGYWCWTAGNWGKGGWNKCKRWQNCQPNDDANFGCGRNCRRPGVCGCSC